MKSDTLPPRGQPTGGFKNYSDCMAFHSITCCRPDCRRCNKSLHAGFNRCIEDLLAVVRFLSKGRELPETAQRLVDHFDPKLNANSKGYDQQRIDSLVAEIERGA